MTLSADELTTFRRDGFVVIRNAVDRTVINACREQLWDLLPESPSDPRTWTKPVEWVTSPVTPEFAAAASAPALTMAYDQLVGPSRWKQRVELGNIPVRFPTGTDSGDTGWHFDGSFTVADDPWPYVNVHSRDRGLLMLFLISDVDTDDAPTRIKVGSHRDVPRRLAPYGEAGATIFTICGDDLTADGWPYSSARSEALATGSAGDVYLCHPFLVHAAQIHRGTIPRFMSQPGLELTQQFDLANPSSPVEKAIVEAL